MVTRTLVLLLVGLLGGLARQADLPHYFSLAGVEKCGPVSDPLEARKTLLWALTQTRSMWPTGENGWVSIPSIVGQGIWEDAVAHGKGFRIYFRDYKRDQDGKVYYYDARGIHALSQQEFATLKAYLVSEVHRAASFVWDINKNLLDAIKQRGVELTEILSPPKIYGPEWFVPDELYFGPIAPWGMVYLGLYDGYTRRVFIHPEALLYDCIAGKPVVLAHEFAHAQPAMQYLPLAWYTDVEILTELQSGIFEDHFWELTHPYLMVLNDLIEAYFGYSYRKSGGSALFRSDSAGLVWPSEQRVTNHQKIWEKIVPAIREWVVNGLLPDFYADPLYAMGINMRYCWDSAFLVVSWSSWFELAGLGGYEATQAWLAKNEQVINTTWELARQDVGLPKEDQNGHTEETVYPERDFCPQPFSFAMLENESVRRLVTAIKKDYKEKGKEYVVYKLLRGGYR